LSKKKRKKQGTFLFPTGEMVTLEGVLKRLDAFAVPETEYRKRTVCGAIGVCKEIAAENTRRFSSL
jgi:hypothetical protein